MKIDFENLLDASHAYPLKKQAIVTHKGLRYQKIGKSYQKLLLQDQFYRVLGIVGKIALSILCIGIPLMIPSFRSSIATHIKEIKKGQEKVVHFVLITSNQKPNSAKELKKSEESIGIEAQLNCMIDQMEELLKRVIFAEIQAVDCFIKVECENEGFKKELIIKNEDHSIMNKLSLTTHLEKAKQVIKEGVDEKTGACKRISWLILLKGVDPSQFYQIHGDIEEVGLLRNSNEGYAGGKAALTSTLTILEDMGFPRKEAFIREGAFVPGAYYQSIF